MQIREILVNLDVDLFSPALVQCALDLAKRFDAGLIGHSAAALPIAMSYQTGPELGVMYDRERKDIEVQLQTIEQQFRAAVSADVSVTWRGSIEQPTTSAARLARSADLVITGSNFGGGNRNPQRCLDTGELIVRAGRPVMVAGMGLSRIKFDSIVVGWKDSREARRAVADALPLLQAAKRIAVVTIHEGNLEAERASLDDVLVWMRGHGIDPTGDMQPEAAGGPAETLETLALALGADLIVTGGYGHSRMQEWMFGGMTRDLLSDRAIHRFMSN